ncbi:uncharacterized protein LOC101891279 [Musca domestica]|uniref:Uncharacterized protein LOC101891279 n=1 Tax=Musca domestica TaxID=7370 RepID=A0A9J7D4N8_MUSDO|nr:uncharacterized protein LOC101891279 [Musca domestica]
MAKTWKICRICRTEKNLKFTKAQLREFNKKQRLSAQDIQGSVNDKASKKLLRTTPTLGNICKDCDIRVQIFHRLDDTNNKGDTSDIEVDVEDATAPNILPTPPTDILPTSPLNRADTPVIVDDDVMLYDLFMQKVDQQNQKTQAKALHDPKDQQPYINHYSSQYTPPQSTGGSEGDDAKMLDVLTSRESTPIAPVINTPESRPSLPPDIVDKQGHRIVAIIDLDDDDSNVQPKPAQEDLPLQNPTTAADHNSQQVVVIAQAIIQTECNNNSNKVMLTPINSTTSSTSHVNSTKCDDADDDDDEKIVFRRVEPDQEQTSAKKKKRKSYDEKQLRLVASLSLVSSDSETEEPPSKQPKLNPKVVVEQTTSYACSECKINLPDAESLRVHKVTHDGHKCPQCKLGFSQEKRLVHHMRYKHRNYNGPVLKEKPRAAQDSAMTIRLRYMQRLTFYECQLCGLIDEVYKEHKDHIIKKHPVESKTLQDPIMKELKCPLSCKWTGSQYLALCRHFLEKHEFGQYKIHLREVVHASSFGWSAKRQQEVAKTARIYQFSKRKSFFFQCKICQKVVAGYPNHVKHLKENHDNNKKEVSASSKEKPSADKKHDKNKKSTTPAEVVEKKKSKQNTKTGSIVKKLENSTKKKESTKQTKQKDLKSCKKSPVSKKSQKLDNSKLLTKKSAAVQMNLTKPKIKDSAKTKQKSLDTKTKNTNTTLSTAMTTTTAATESANGHNNEKQKPNAAGKRKRKDLSASLKSQLKIVKVKAPVKQIKLQSYTCNYCKQSLKGFLPYNRHMCEEHADHEFQQCDKCHGMYLNGSHIDEQCSNLKLTNQQKRKFLKVIIGGGGDGDGDDRKIETSAAASASEPDVNCNWRKTLEDQNRDEQQQKVPECKNETNLPVVVEKDQDNVLPKTTTTITLPPTEPPLWLRDLMKLNSGSSNLNNTAS